MATTTKFGAVKNTSGGSFVRQRINGVVLGIEATGTNPVSASLSIMDNLPLTDAKMSNADPRERSSSVGIYRAKKILSGGTFLYNAAVNRTFVIARIATALAGVAATNLLFMGQASKGVKTIHDFNHDFGVKMLTLWVNNRFSWTGRLANGTSKLSRTMWLSADGSAVATPSSLGGVFMRDLADGNATDKAVDHAVQVSPTLGVRAIPGEFTLRIDFVTAGLSGGNFFDYRPITGF